MAISEARGYTALELLLATAVAALASATTIPVVAGALEYERAHNGARYLWMRLHHSQLDALRQGRIVALLVNLDETDACLRPFADGNGNGVLSRDIEQGLDPPIGPAECLGTVARGVALRINQPVADIGGTGWLPTGADPLRIGRTSLVSFSPTGSTTAGTLYVAAERGPQFALRLTGASGRIRLLRFDPGSASWRP